jgi:cell division protein ZapA
MSTTAVAINILDREYKISCTEEERDALMHSARALDARMRQIRSADKLLTLDRIAVLAALMFAQEAQSKGERFESLSSSLDHELKRINQQLDEVLKAA